MNKINFKNLPDTSTPLSAENLNLVQTNVENAIENVENVELLAVSSTAPSECSTGDKYFNTTTNLIYTATGTNTWSSTGETPIANIFYIELSEQKIYTYNGTTLISVGGGSGVGAETLPVGSEIDFDGTVSNIPAGWEQVTNPESYSTSEVKTNKIWHNNKPIYRKVFVLTSPTQTGTWTDYTHNIANIDEFTDCIVNIKLPDIGHQYFADFYQDSGYYFNFVPKLTMFSARVGYYKYTNKDMTVVVEYTKTTN